MKDENVSPSKPINESDKTVNMICDYIEYLKAEHNLSVSVHFARDYAYIFHFAKPLMKYNIHTNPYCFKIKADKEGHKRCMECQMSVMKKCAGTSSFIGVCHAGVKEYICGIVSDSKVLGFVSVSGYKSDKTPYCNDGAYMENIKNDNVPKRLLDTVIPPICMMAEKLVGINEYKIDKTEVYFRILDYLRENYTDASVGNLAKEFNFSKSYISHMFKKKSGLTLKKYCNILKINDAKALIEGSNMTITEIAAASGFNNFSYFINVFKEITGTTPLKWRSEYRKSPFVKK